MARESKALKAMGARIKALRIERGMTQPELARAAGDVSVKSIQLWEYGEVRPGYENLIAVAEALGATAVYLERGAEAAPSPFGESVSERMARIEAQIDRLASIEASLSRIATALEHGIRLDVPASDELVLRAIQDAAPQPPAPEEEPGEPDAQAEAQ